MAERDLSRNEQRVQRRDRKVDRRQGILPEVDPRQRQLETYGNMRSARRGSGGAETILRSLGMLQDGLNNAQGVAQKQHALDEQENYEQALMDHMLGETNEDRMGRSEAYRRGLGMAQTETRWHAHKAEKDVEFEAFLEQQTEPTLEGRLKEAAAWIEENYFEGFVRDPETGEVLDMGHRDSYMLALGQVQKNRPQLLAAAGQRITSRFEGEAVKLFQSTVRDRVMAGEEINIVELVDRIPPTVPQEEVTAAYLNTAISLQGELERAGRHQEGIALIDQALGLATASLPEEERAALIETVDPDIAGGFAPSPEDFDMAAYMGRNRSAESSGNDTAAASTSSAYGRYQFVQDTWVEFYEKTFGDTGESRSAILAKRADGDVQDKVMETFTQQNVETLAANGLPVNDATVYLMHFLGEGDAVNVLSADPETSVGDLVARSSRKANSSVFSKVRNAGQLIEWAEGKMDVEVGSTGTTPRDPSYQANGLPRSARDRSFDPSAQLLPELQGRFAATAEQRTQLLQLREAAVRRWDAYEDENTARVAEETTGAFALRLVGKGPPMTDADIAKAHREGRISDTVAARWYENIESHRRGEEAYRQAQRDRIDREDAKRAERAARGVLGSAAMQYFNDGGDPREIISTVMGNIRHIPDDLVRGEAIVQATRLAEALEGANLSTPEVQAYNRNVKRVGEALGTKLPNARRFDYIDASGNTTRVTRDEALQLAEAQLGRLSIDAMEAAARGEAPVWADTQRELQTWLQNSFRVPERSSQQQASEGFSN